MEDEFEMNAEDTEEMKIKQGDFLHLTKDTILHQDYVYPIWPLYDYEYDVNCFTSTNWLERDHENDDVVQTQGPCEVKGTGMVLYKIQKDQDEDYNDDYDSEEENSNSNEEGSDDEPWHEDEDKELDDMTLI